MGYRGHGLKGQAGVAANVALSTAAYNMAKLLAWFYCAKSLRQQMKPFTCQFDFNRNNRCEFVA